MESIPVLLITGPVGFGKSTVLAEASRLLREAQVPHAAVDLAAIGAAWPAPADNRWNERLIYRNLPRLWSNFRDSGAKRLLLARVLEERSLSRHVTAAVPGAHITVMRLRAPKEVLEARIRHREEGRDPRGTWKWPRSWSRSWSDRTLPTTSSRAATGRWPTSRRRRFECPAGCHKHLGYGEADGAFHRRLILRPLVDWE